MLEILAFILIIFLAIIGTPIFVVMGGAALTAFYFVDISGSAVAIDIYKISSAPTLLTIPLFTFAGYMMAESKSPARLLRLAQAALGWLPGGVAIISLIVCAFFTAFTGASGVTIVAMGGLLFPILLKEGYSEKFSLGLITTSGSLGLLFPPSLPIILYGIIAKVDIDKLFLAGVLPGILLILVLSLWSVFNGRKKNANHVSETLMVYKFSLKELKSAIWGARYELPLPVAVLLGIYGGYTTPSEASAITAFYVLIMEFFLYKDLKISRDMGRIIGESMTLVGAILLILCCALGLTNYLVDEEIPMKILEFIREYITNKYAFLLLLNVLLLILGCLMDIFSAIIVVVPLIVPIAEEFGVNPLHLAIVFLTNLEIGYMTPPVGINLFLSSFRFNKPITELYRASIPFLILLLLALAIITYVPSLTLAWFN